MAIRTGWIGRGIWTWFPLLVPEAEWEKFARRCSSGRRCWIRFWRTFMARRTAISRGTASAGIALLQSRIFAGVSRALPCRAGSGCILYAADLMRTGDGQFRVLSDRTQAPSGAGYSLENRIVLSGILPTVFRQCNVQRLAPFFIALRRTLTSLAPANVENPRVVLLTPGPYNETYFEHAYLARYLGYTLVQGNDLTVRDGRVYLKTLGELQRVDVILRRVDDDYCDPLELYAAVLPGRAGIGRSGARGKCRGRQCAGQRRAARRRRFSLICRRFAGVFSAKN